MGKFDCTQNDFYRSKQRCQLIALTPAAHFSFWATHPHRKRSLLSPALSSTSMWRRGRWNNAKGSWVQYANVLWEIPTGLRPPSPRAAGSNGWGEGFPPLPAPLLHKCVEERE